MYLNFRMEFYRQIIQAVILSVVTSIAIGKHNCNACIDGACYSRAPVIDKHRLSGQLAIDRNSNIVYFHYEDDQSVDYSAAFDLDDIRLKIIPNIGFSFARTVDQSTGEVYIGGAHGIFKYSPMSNKTVNFGLFDETIWHLQYQNNIYYTIFMRKGLFRHQNSKSSNIKALSNYSIDDFVVSKNSDVYFLSDSKVYRLKSGTSHASLLFDDAYSLSISGDDGIYFVQPASRGLYKLSNKTGQLVEIGAFDSGTPLKFVFDANNNIIYYDKDTEKLYYLIPNFSRCRVTKTWAKNSKKGSVSHSKTVTLNVQKVT